MHCTIVSGLLLLVLVPACTSADASAPERASPAHADSSANHRLATLGQVWGFLKYFHPGVAAGTIDWDGTLVAAVPRIRDAVDRGAYHAALHDLLAAAGPLPPCSTCGREYPDSMLHNFDVRWMDDARRIPPSLSSELRRVLDNRHQGPGRYIDFFEYTGHADFRADSAFHGSATPAEAERLLALFRYWNAVHYFFPYGYVNDGDWNDVIDEFVPRMRAAAGDSAYHMTTLELTTRVNDTHVATHSAVIQRVLGARTPAFEARTVEGRIVVWGVPRHADAAAYPLRVGDVITHVNGASIERRRDALRRFVAAGNAATFERNLTALVLRSGMDSVTYAVERSGEALRLRVAMGEASELDGPRPRPEFAVPELVRVLPGNIGYVDIGGLERVQVDSALAIIRDTRGLVIDVRNYPRGTFDLFASFLNRGATPFVAFTSPEPSLYGAFAWGAPIAVGAAGGNVGHYRGRVAILVDERSQSHSEFTVMALQTAPDSRVFGSQTAGADGNVTPIFLPGGIRTRITGLGVYYPDGRQTQRIGIVPDVEAHATIAGVQAGRDEVLERALEWLRRGG